MPIHDHEPNALGRAFLWGGIALGVLCLAALLTHGFGLLGGAGKSEEAPAAIEHRGDKIYIPQGSALRNVLSVMPAKTEAVSPTLVLPAVVESDPARTAQVSTPLSGRLAALKVGLGDRVRRGQILAVIDSPDLGQAYDDDTKASDTLRLTTVNLGRQEGQHELGVVSDRDFDQAKSDHTQAAAEYERTQAHLKVLGVPLEPKERSRLLAIVAPFAGSVTALSVAPGTMINDPTQPLMTVADLSRVWITALVPEKDVGLVSKGEQADVALLAYPGRTRQGKVSFVSDVIESDSRRNKLRIDFANADYALKPNMFAIVTLTRPAQSQVVLPSSALLMNNDRTTVFVATAPWTFERRTVDPQLEEGSSVAIRSGLQAGEQVVVKGGILLND